MDGAALPCVRCDYDLRTLDPAGVCPECATPIAESVAAAADPLRSVGGPMRLATGVLLAAVALRLAFAATLAAFHVTQGLPRTALGYAMSLALDPWPFDDVLSAVADFGRRSLAVRVLYAWLAVSFAVLVAGIWLITAPWARLVGWAMLRHGTRWAVVAIVTMGAMLLWRPTNDLLGFLVHAPAVAGTAVGPPLLVAAWTSRVWWCTFRIAGRPRSSLLPSIAIVATGVAAVVNHVRPGVNPRAWLAAAVSTLALLLLAWMWRDLWRLAARPASRAPEGTMA